MHRKNKYCKLLVAQFIDEYTNKSFEWGEKFEICFKRYSLLNRLYDKATKVYYYRGFLVHLHTLHTEARH